MLCLLDISYYIYNIYYIIYNMLWYVVCHVTRFSFLFFSFLFFSFLFFSFLFFSFLFFSFLFFSFLLTAHMYACRHLVAGGHPAKAISDYCIIYSLLYWYNVLIKVSHPLSQTQLSTPTPITVSIDINIDRGTESCNRKGWHLTAWI